MIIIKINNPLLLYQLMVIAIILYYSIYQLGLFKRTQTHIILNIQTLTHTQYNIKQKQKQKLKQKQNKQIFQTNNICILYKQTKC